MPEENIATRLKFLISNLGINSSVFADNCGIKRATLSQIITERNKKVSDLLISQIHKAYPDLSILWLLFNEGEMWIKPDDEQTGAIDANPVYSPSSERQSSQNFTDRVNNGSVANPSNGINFDDGDKNPSENLKFLDNGQALGKYSTEKGLNSSNIEVKANDSESVNSCLKTAELINEINKLKAKIRKVVQITIYYDDSTFESFYPGPKKP